MKQLLKNHTTFRIGGPAELFAIPSNIDELQKLLKTNRQKLFILGGGSNLLVSDSGFAGLVIKTEKINYIKRSGNQITAGAGTPLPKLIRYLSNAGLSGLEQLAGIPGTVGGAVKGNAGANGSAIGEYVEIVKGFTNKGKQKKYSKKRLKFSYRKSSISGIIYEVVFKFKKSSKKIIQQRIKKAIQERKKKQPWGEYSAGSIFKNPKGMSAWRLIEGVGLKGQRVGGAMVSKKHANFIVNCGNATAQDVKKLILKMKTTIEKKFKILLRNEVVFVE
ncbi:UDP-N-acetylmuramate dehydrogenase [Candidatus Margulisiibacteriota bacterium]